MKFILPIIALLCLAGCQNPLAAQLADAQADNADLVRQLNEADAKAKGADSLADELSNEVLSNSNELADLESQFNAADLDRQHLQSELRTLGTEKAEAEKKCEQLTAERDAAISEAMAARKTALLAARDSCPPPEVIPKETQKQEFAPSFERADGTKIWRTDFDWDESKAKELHRLQFVMFGTRSCPHCDWAMTQCSDQTIGAYVFKQFVPCWITVQDRATSALADQFGVNKFRYPAAMLRDPNTGKFEMWRPSKDNGQLQSEIAEHAEALK